MKSNLFFILLFVLSVSALKGQMILEYNTNLSDGTSVTLPLYGNVDVSVDWGDGNGEMFTGEGNKYHEYEIDGIYTVTISGTLTHFGSSNYPNADMLTRIIDFGDVGLTDLSYACNDAVNLTEVPIQIPDEVTNLSFMFFNANAFNQDIGNWDVSNVTNMSSMFERAFVFNHSIESWDVSNVTNMGSMFKTAMDFNQTIEDWDVSNVTDMKMMFCNADDFDQPIGNWDVSSVTDMQYMFYSNLSFNQNIYEWDVSGVTNMQGMFMESGFNLKIGDWDVSSVTDFSRMFRRSNYNNDLNNWDVSSATNMKEMFYQAIAFDKDIGHWDVSSVTDMRVMFFQADYFDQDIGDWNVSNVTNMDNMFYLVTLSVDNYDALLIGWASLDLQPNVNFSGGYSQYSCVALAAHDILTNDPNNWIITDGGCIEDEVDPTITCPSDFTIIADDESQTYTVQGTELDPLVFDDNCEGSFITNDFNSSNSLFNSVFNLGTTYVSWTVEDANGNQNTCSFNVTVETFTGIKDEYKKSFLLISPNPTNDYLTIDCCNLHEYGDYSLKITNSMNQIIYSAPLVNKQTKLNLSMLTSKGIYYVYLLDSYNQIIGIEKLVLQ